MTFLHPLLAAAGLAAISIPILIHLLMRRRRRPVRWAAMRFLQEAYRKHKRRLTLEQLILLFVRSALVALLGAALAQPLLGAAGVLGSRSSVTLYVLLDNSLTAQIEDEQGTTALARHQQQASDLLGQLDPARGDRAGLVLLGAPAESVVVPASADVAAVRDAVQRLTAVDSRADVSGALATLRDQMREDGVGPGTQIVVAVLSDFLTGTGELDRTLPTFGSVRDVELLLSRALAVGIDNVSIVNVQSRRPVLVADASGPGVPAQVRIELRRTGPGVGESGISTVHLVAGADTTVAPLTATVSWDPGESEAVALLTPDRGFMQRAAGAKYLEARIDADALPADDVYRRPIDVRQVLRVGIIAPRRFGGPRGIDGFEPADWVRAALTPSAAGGTLGGGASDGMEIRVIEPDAVDVPRLAMLDAAMVLRPDMLSADTWSRLRTFADAGGLVVITPPEGDAVNTWTDALIESFQLDWSIAREPVELDPAVTLSADRSAAPPREDLLELLGPELAELVGSVTVSRVLSVAPGRAATDVLLRLEGGAPLLIASTPASGDEATASRGRVIYLAAPLDLAWTTLPARPLMVPLMQELVRQGIGRARGVGVSIAGDTPQAPPGSATLSRTGGGQDVLRVDPRTGEVNRPVRQSGIWRAEDAQGASRGLVAINPDPTAGRTDPTDPESVRSWLGQVTVDGGTRWLDEALPAGGGGPALSTRQAGASISMTLLIAVMALLLVEIVLARVASHASATTSERGALA